MAGRRYYAFDLDGTLSDIHGLNDYLDIFKMPTSNNNRRQKLENAYKIFIRKVVEKTDIQECTLFNSEMISLIKENVSDAVIYSNNSDPNVLVFVKDVIEGLVKRPVFCYLMHWDHELRKNEIVRNDPGNARKTWSVLKKAFAKCGHGVEPQQVFYFDDQEHPDLIDHVNYTKVEEYRTDLDSNNALINKLFHESINESGLRNGQPLNEGNFNELPEMSQDGGRRKRKTNKKTNKKRRPK